MTTHRSDTIFITPLDVLVLRGNKLFANAGSHGEALMPPWPSVAAGALRSRMLADTGISPADFAVGRASLPDTLAASLGSVAEPGAFRIAHFGLARKTQAGIEPLLPMPADIVVDDADRAAALRPQALAPAIASSYPLPLTPTLLQDKAGKPKSGLWLTTAGIAAWQQGQPLNTTHWLPSSRLWQTDIRLGIGLQPGLNTVAEGQLYTTETIHLRRDHAVETGFIVQVQGAAGLLPEGGLLRFGGDGHAAGVTPCTAALPAPDLVALARAGRFRLLLTSPGLFAEGWRLPGTDDNGRWHFYGASARLASAAVPRLETVSGWDLANRSPKPALRAVPAGSVYWLDQFQGDVAAFERLIRDGLPMADRTRRAEGFTNGLLAAWL